MQGMQEPVVDAGEAAEAAGLAGRAGGTGASLLVRPYTLHTTLACITIIDTIILHIHYYTYTHNYTAYTH
jgi:hypothetical protein